MIKSLQMLRALAALAVVINHLPAANRITPRVDYGAVGVDVFFIISGFIMVHASAHLFGQPGAAREFLANRISRIVPLYWLTTTAGLIAYAVFYGGGAPPADALACTFAFLPCGLPGGIPLNGPGWTLNYEMFFYAVFAAALFLPRRAAVTAVAVVLLALVCAGEQMALPMPLYFWSHPIVIEFVLGMLLALAYGAGLRVPQALCITLIGLGVVGFVASWYGGFYFNPLGRPAVPRSLIWGVPALLIVAGAVLPREERKPGLPAAFMSKIGDASYSVYLLHPLMIFSIATFGAVNLAGTFADPYLEIVLDIVVLVALSIAVNACFERSMKRLVRKAISRPPASLFERRQADSASRRGQFGQAH